MKLRHIAASENVVDLRIVITEDMDATYGPALAYPVEALPVLNNILPEIALASGLASCAVAAATIIAIAMNWRR